VDGHLAEIIYNVRVTVVCYKATDNCVEAFDGSEVDGSISINVLQIQNGNICRTYSLNCHKITVKENGKHLTALKSACKRVLCCNECAKFAIY